MDIEPAEVKEETHNENTDAPKVDQAEKVNDNGEYNPFQRYMEDEMQEVYSRLYDAQYQKYMEEAENRVAYQLALAYFKDANPVLGSIVNEFTGRDIVLLDKEDRHNLNGMHLLFVKNCLRHLNVTADEFEDIQLTENQIVIVSDDLSLSEGSLKKLAAFVHSGGLLLSYNKGISVLEKALPGHFVSKHGETIKDKGVAVEIPETGDKDLLLGLENAALGKKVVRYQGTRRFQVVESASGVTVLAKETGVTAFPLAIKANHGQGLIFHISPVGTNVC